MSATWQSNYGGYDAPCPPWNDARLHHYHFIVYAIDAPTLVSAAILPAKTLRRRSPSTL
jgi:phosphatidylethanolamine-binding protein (PEBP) family uncharacterized protein